MDREIVSYEIEPAAVLDDRGFAYSVRDFQRLGLAESFREFHECHVLAERCLGDEVQRAKQQGIDEAPGNIAEDAQMHLRLGLELDKEQRGKAGQCVKDKNIAAPYQEEMHQPEQQEPAEPPRLQGDAGAARPCPLKEQVHARPEQQGEQPAHLAVDKDELDDPHPVGAVVMPRQERVGVHIGLEGLPEGDDVRRQYAHHGQAADEIEAANAVGRCDRLVGCISSLLIACLRVRRIHCIPLESARGKLSQRKAGLASHSVGCVSA